jgi:hypothetical protein
VNLPPKFIRGMRGYATVLATLRTPMTVDVLSGAVGCGTATLRQVVRRLHVYGLIHVAGWHRDKPCGPYAALWAEGEGSDVPYPKANSRWKWADRSNDTATTRVEMLTFKHVMDALDDPHTLASLREITGATKAALQALLQHMRALRLARIAGWERADNGIPMPLFRMGAGRDADRPRANNHNDQCRVNQRKAAAREMTLRIVHLTAAPLALAA